jgi:hypothetical protein
LNAKQRFFNAMIKAEHNGNKLAYFCVPKCGKTSVKSLMAEIGRPNNAFYNYGAKQFNIIDRKRAKDCYRFTVVRDPLSRLVSAYSDRIADRDDVKRSALSTVLCKPLGLNPTPGIEEFVLNLRKYALINDRVYRHVIPQVNYVGKDDSYYDAIYKIQDIPKLADDLSEMLGLSLATRQQNSSKKKASLSDLSNEAIESAKEYYAMDYKVLGRYL